jgi:hypothetical protein
MKFDEKNIHRSIREFRDLAQNILNANNQLYQDRVEKFVTFIKEDDVIQVVIKPFLEFDINYDQYLTRDKGRWYQITLPKSKDKEIGFTLGLLFKSANGEFEMADWGNRMFNISGSVEEGIMDVNNQLLRPVFQELSNRLDDLIEDKVEGSEKVDAQNLTIVKVGNISATNSNIAVGNNNKQENQIGFKGEIVKKLLEKGIEYNQIELISSNLDNFIKEAEKENPDEGKLKKFFKPIFDVGKQVAANVITNVIQKPEVIAAISGYASSV